MEFVSSNVMAYIYEYCDAHSIPINRTKAQKLLYCCYGVVLAVHHERLTDETPKAWMYGPVFPRTYSDIKKKRLTSEMSREFVELCPCAIRELVDRTIDTFGVYSARALSEWSHKSGSPWSKTVPLMSLNDADIQSYFATFIPVVQKQDSK